MVAAGEEPHGGVVLTACDACGEAFARPEHLALHRGRAHGVEDAEYARALAAEEAWLALYGRHARGALAAMPVGLALVLVILLAYYGGVPVGLALLLVPGSAAFATVLYYLAWSREPDEDGRLAVGAEYAREDEQTPELHDRP